MRKLTVQQLEAFQNSLILDEKSKATIQKYMRDVRVFYAFTLEKEVKKEQLIAYKKHLLEHHYAVRTVNSMLCSVNRLMYFLGWEDCIVKGLRLQKQIYQSEQKELTKAEYRRLLRAAEHKPRMQMILRTIGCTGIRVSELQYFTVDSVKKQKILISCKGKIRTILLQGENTHHFTAVYAAKTAAKLLQAIQDSQRNGVLYAQRKTAGSEQYLGSDEKVVYCGERCERKSIPAQPAKIIRQNILLCRKRYCATS